jgi:hypothetical protein
VGGVEAHMYAVTITLKKVIDPLLGNIYNSTSCHSHYVIAPNEKEAIEQASCNYHRNDEKIIGASAYKLPFQIRGYGTITF